MAPPSSSMLFDYRTQIIENCAFFVCKDDYISVITVKDALADFKAYAIRCNERSREALLSSESSGTVQKAIESLHTKSCEAVHQYIATNGFSNPPDLKQAKLDSDNEEEEDDDDDDDDDDAESVISGRSASTAVLSEWDSSDNEALTPATSAENHGGCSKTASSNRHSSCRNKSCGKKVTTGSGKPHHHGHPRRPRPPYVDDDSDSDSVDGRQHRLPPRVRLASPVRSSSTAYRPPPPMISWMSSPAPPLSMRGMPGMPPHHPPMPQHQPQQQQQQQPPAMALQHRQLPPGMSGPAPAPIAGPAAHNTAIPPPGPIRPPLPSPPTGSNGNSPSPIGPISSPRLYDVRLTIRWLHHHHNGNAPNVAHEQRVIESCRASVRALQDAALSYVRTHPGLFFSFPSSSTSSSSPVSSDQQRSSPPLPPLPLPSPSFPPAPAPAPSPQQQRLPPGHHHHHQPPPQRIWNLRACVRQAFFGAEAYDMSTYRGDDLTKLFHVLSAGSIPRFEIEIVEVGHGHGVQNVVGSVGV